MIMKANKQIGFIYKNNESIDKILKDGDVVFERGFLRERTSTTLPITFGGVGKDLKDYKIYGNTYQNSTSGKSLFNKIDYTTITTGNNGNATNSKTSNKITITLGTGVASGIYITRANIISYIDNYNDNNTYYLSADIKTTRNTVMTIGGDNRPANINVNSTISKILVETKFTTNGLVFYANSGYQTNDILEITNIMISTSNDETYEPYTGGQPSPNPDYPQEIISCGNKTKNLFDKNNANVYGGYLSASGIVSGSGASSTDTIVYIECEPNTTYALQKMLQSDTENNRLRIGCTSEIPVQGMSVSNFFRYADGTTETQYVYTTSSTAKYLLFYCGKKSDTTSRQEILDSVQIEEGSTVSPYEPFGYKIPININGNITNIYLDEPLRKTKDGTYVDYIDYVNGKVVRKIYEYKITGNETWERTYGVNLFNIDRMFNDKPFIPSYGLCNMYKYNSVQSGINANTVNGEFALQKSVSGRGSTTYNLFIKNTSYSDKDLFKTYLQNLYNNNTPVIINYPLETPTEESITLPNIPTIEGNNTLNIETEVTPSQVYIKYKSNN